MKEIEIEKRNTAIAEFMGGKLHKASYCNHSFSIVPRKMPDNPDPYLVKGNLKYHSSWDWLMPVVERLSRKRYENGQRLFMQTFGMIDEDKKVMVRIHLQSLVYGRSLIEATFIAVSDYCLSINK